MTDLERHWDELPVRPAPVDRILRDAHREQLRADAAAARRPESRLRRPLRRAAVIGGVAAAFVAGTVVTQPGGDDPARPGAGDAPDGASPVAFHGALQAPESCDDLLAEYVERGVDLVGAYGWGQPYPYYRDFGAPMPADGELPSALTESTADRVDQAPRIEGSYSSDTGTTVQEAGVDEPDTVKTDGAVLVRLDGAQLTTYDVREDQPGIDQLGEVDLGDFHDGEILLDGDTVVAVGTDGTRPVSRVVSSDSEPVSQTRVVTIDLSDPAAPEVVDTVDYDAAAVTARQHGDVIRLVVNRGLPDLDFVVPIRRSRFPTVRAALHENQRLVRQTTLDDWLPRQRTGEGGYQQFLDCDAVAVPRDELGLGTTAVVGFGADAPAETRGLAVAGDASLAYESSDHLYLAAPRSASCPFAADCAFTEILGDTHVYGFALDGPDASYLGDAEVEGHVRDRWSMDEQDGVLRLAVGPTSETGNFNSIVTLKARGDRLEEIGRLDRLGVGEDIKSVRWFSNLAILVTFRQVDPLYAIDLTHQAEPRLRGELKIPGFSEYLHPLGSRRLIGMGQGPGPNGRGWGAQAGFFDVTDIDRPRRLDVVHYGSGTEALAAVDPRQFTWLPGPRVAITVVMAYRGGSRVGEVSAIRLNAGRMTESRRVVEYGADVAAVRAVPLPGDRVALVTGDDVELFPLGEAR